MPDSSSTRGVASSIFSGMYNLGCVILFPTCLSICMFSSHSLSKQNVVHFYQYRHLSRDNLKFRDTFVGFYHFITKTLQKFRLRISVRESKNAGCIYSFCILVDNLVQSIDESLVVLVILILQCRHWSDSCRDHS